MNRGSLRLWDPLVRLFHVSIAGVFVANYFFNEAGGDWHIWLGYYAVAWLAVRVVWGFIGPRSACWSDFWPNPARLRTHIRSLIERRPMHRLGHSGFLMEEVDALWGSDWPQDIHEILANTLCALVVLHMAAAIFESVQVRDNLPLSMLTGKRRPLPEDRHR
ncbi:cytochrome B [Pseudomonas syringae pv. syringae]|nr:cytochrome B [Pseudomonas syringae pv. syringae]